MAERLHEQHFRLLHAVLNGALSRFSETRQLRYFVDAVRLCIGKSPIYIADASNEEDAIFADELDWHQPGEEWDAVERTNYAKTAENAAAPRLTRQERERGRSRAA